MPEVHAKLSASISKRWMLNVEKNLKGCPGSIMRGLEFPANGPNDAADTGTAAHLICEWGLNEGKCPSEFPDHHPTPYIDVDGNHIEINDDLISGPKLYCETIWEDIQELEDEHLDEGMIFVEEQVSINDIFEDGDIQKLIDFADENMIIPVSANKLSKEVPTCDAYYARFINEMFNMFGTNDASYLIPGVILCVYDYKNGRWPVEVENNTQFLYYALGAAFAHDWNFEEVEMVVVQPNDMQNEEKVRRWRITKDELRAWIPIFRQAALDTIYKWDTYTPSQDNCHFCPAKGGCEDQKKLVSDICKMDFAEDFEEDIDTDEEVLIAPPLGGLNYDELRRIADNADFIKNYVDSVLKLVRNLVENGDDKMKERLNRKLVQGSSRRSYKHTEKEIIAFLEDELLLDREDFMVQKLMPMGKLEKILEKSEFNQLVHRPEPPIIMVSLDDDRPEVATGAKSDFEDESDLD